MTTRIRPQLLAIAALAGLAVAMLAACGGDDDGGGDDGGEARDVTLMLNWVPNTHHSGIYIAQEQGYYEEEGLNLTIIEPALGGVEQVVGSSEVEFGISIQEGVIPARAAGVPVVSIGTIIQHNDSSLISLSNDGIEGPGDLAGHTYGGFGGALERELVSRLVECGGGDPDAVDFVDIGNANYLAGMQDDSYDFVWVFEGWDTLRFREIDGADLNSIEFIDHLDCIPDWYTPLFITNEDMIANDPDVVRAFMAATARGYEDAINDPELAAESLLAGAPETDRELAEASATYYQDRYVDSGRQWGLQDDSIWSAFATFLEEAGLVEDAGDVGSAWTNDFLPE